jgi:chromosome transmission fidelity protein 18
LSLSLSLSLRKTTLAHIVSKHCGYGVIEINASDDRSAEAFRSKLLAAITSSNVSQPGRPNLVIVDEVDGVGTGGGGDGVREI